MMAQSDKGTISIIYITEQELKRRDWDHHRSLWCDVAGGLYWSRSLAYPLLGWGPLTWYLAKLEEYEDIKNKNYI